MMNTKIISRQDWAEIAQSLEINHSEADDLPIVQEIIEIVLGLGSIKSGVEFSIYSQVEGIPGAESVLALFRLLRIESAYCYAAEIYYSCDEIPVKIQAARFIHSKGTLTPVKKPLTQSFSKQRGPLQFKPEVHSVLGSEQLFAKENRKLKYPATKS